MKSEAEKNIEADNLVFRFNDQFPVGSTVRWRSVGSDKVAHREYTVRFSAENRYGQAVVWFEEKSGMCSIEPQFVDYWGDK